MLNQTLGKFSVGETIARGSFSVVRHCTDITTSKPYALRVIDRQKIEEVGLLESLKNEITIMKMFNHANVVTVVNMMASTNRIFLVIDVMTAGNMKKKLFIDQFLNEEEAIFYFSQFVSGVEYLHSMGVTHGNLRLENILLSTNGSLRITDFSMSTILDTQDPETAYDDLMGSQNDDTSDMFSTSHNSKCNSLLSKQYTLKHSPHYLAPEVIDDDCDDSKKADLWSVGVILYAMTVGFFPFGGEIELRRSKATVSNDPFYSFTSPNIDEISSNSQSIVENILSANIEPYPQWISDSLKSLLEGIFTLDPDDRYTLQQIKESDWMDREPLIPDSSSPFEKIKINGNKNGSKNGKIITKKTKTTKMRRKSSISFSDTSSFSSFFDCICHPISSYIVTPTRGWMNDRASDDDNNWFATGSGNGSGNASGGSSGRSSINWFATGNGSGNSSGGSSGRSSICCQGVNHEGSRHDREFNGGGHKGNGEEGAERNRGDGEGNTTEKEKKEGYGGENGRGPMFPVGYTSSPTEMKNRNKDNKDYINYNVDNKIKNNIKNNDYNEKNKIYDYSIKTNKSSPKKHRNMASIDDEEAILDDSGSCPSHMTVINFLSDEDESKL